METPRVLWRWHAMLYVPSHAILLAAEAAIPTQPGTGGRNTGNAGWQCPLHQSLLPEYRISGTANFAIARRTRSDSSVFPQQLVTLLDTRLVFPKLSSRSLEARMNQEPSDEERCDSILALLRKEVTRLVERRGYFGRFGVEVFIRDGHITGFDTHRKQTHK